MGLFTSIFGGAGSDKADKFRQQALDAFNAVKTPELSALQVQLQKYVEAGTLTPEQAEAQLLSSNAFNDIVTDPSYVGAQKQALQQLQSVATEGGLTAVDKAQLNDINNAQNQQNRSQNAATMQQAQQRGVGNSDLNAVNQLINEQGNADRAANSGVQVAANAQQRALQAMQAAGQAGGALQSQAYGEAANKANAQNAIDLYNKQALNQTNLFNTQTANAAQGANLANKQAVSNANTGTENTNLEYNAQQNQQVYNDQMQKAQGIAAVNQNAANAAQANKNAEMGADLGLTSGLLQGGAMALGGAFGGPAGAAVASKAAAPKSLFDTTSSSDPNVNYSQGGRVTDPEHPDHMSMGGHVHCYSHGGEAFHHPECMANGGEVEASSDTAHIPAATPEDSREPEKSFIQRLGDLLGSHGEIGNKVEENQGGMIEGQAKEEHASVQTPSLPPIEWNQGESHWDLKDKDGQVIGNFPDYASAAQYSEKVKDKETPVQKDFRGGGPVPGKAKVKGDSPKNDTVDAKLSPGEIVVPRSAANDEDEFKSFMSKFEPKKRKMADGGVVPKQSPVKIPPEVRALVNLHKRVSKLEKP